jgi:hypothetical protein
MEDFASLKNVTPIPCVSQYLTLTTINDLKSSHAKLLANLMLEVLDT